MIFFGLNNMKNSSILTWSVGLVGMVLLGLLYNIMSTNAEQTGRLTQHERELGGITAKLERIPIIEAKLDTILETRSIDPRNIERIVEQKISLRLASTTQ